jgi:hypothetical protein
MTVLDRFDAWRARFHCTAETAAVLDVVRAELVRVRIDITMEPLPPGTWVRLEDFEAMRRAYTLQVTALEARLARVNRT